MTWPPQPEPRYSPHQHAPHLRATDADRDLVAERVRSAVSDGRLQMTELDARIGAVYGARTHGELAEVLRDLVPEPAAPPPYPTASAYQSPAVPHGYELVRTDSDRTMLLSLLLCFFFGLVGAHRFYAGRHGSAIGMIAASVFTLGIAGSIWMVVDLIIIASGSLRDGDGRRIRRWT